jgi:chromosome segregation ATPase
VSKKGVGTRDHRAEPDESPTGENLRVDRVFIPPAAPRRDTGPIAAPRRDTGPIAAPRRDTGPIATPRRSGTTLPPQLGTVPGMDDAEIALRRQLSRLQRQLADAQRELANKDEELAATVEKRVEIAGAYDAAITQLREAHEKLVDLEAEHARVAGVEQRLQDAIAAGDELTHQLARERAERATMSTQLEEANGELERARALWRDETKLVQEQHTAELARLEQHKRAAIDAAEAAMKEATERAHKAHEAELEELRGAHERSLAALRGELEPKVAEARNLAAEIERLTSEIGAVRSEQLRELAERNELFRWEQQQAQEGHAAEVAALTRKHETELAAANEELAAKSQTLGQAERNAELREQLWEQTTSDLRESQKKLQHELAESKERAAQSDAAKWGVEQRLVTTLQQLEKATESQRELEKRVEAAEAEARRNGLDRQRFVAYLEEGLAMLGALPPTAESQPVKVPVAAEAPGDKLKPD